MIKTLLLSITLIMSTFALADTSDVKTQSKVLVPKSETTVLMTPIVLIDITQLLNQL